MLRSLFSAVSGLRAQQTMMDVIGNNIANVNTSGYKGSSTVFEDTLSQVVKAAGSPQGASGGTNPAQVGLGVRLGAITTNFAQGATQLTGRQTDVAIGGDGFFVVKQDGQTLYSRAGAFTFDARGSLVNPDGAVVQGWLAKDGAVNSNAAVTDLVLPVGKALPPKQTAAVTVGGNLPADAPLAAAPPAAVVPGSTIVSSIDIFDSQGKAIPATFTYSHTAAGTWSVDVSVPKADGTPQTVGTATLAWDDATKTFSPATMTLAQAGLTGAGYSFGSDVTVALGTATKPLTQYAAANTVQALSQDGSAIGSLQSFTLNGDGTLIGLFSNGLKQALGQVALANFNNPPGLEKVGGSLYAGTANSGNAAVGTAGSAGRGTLASGALEMSNVDLAQEFTNLVVAQRGFQANSRVITASDEILQDLINMKR